MQTTETDNKNHKLQSDEEAINFRPSPNFKHMKKYLKSKFEESSNPSTLNYNDDGNCRYNDQHEEVYNNHGEFQPPLPPNPPPPDSPPHLTLKKEIEDDEYNELNNPLSEMSSDTNRSEESVNVFKPHQPEDGKTNEEGIMCRNFIRGTCNRGASCIFVHKVILSQLERVYKFCNDFQNGGCKRRNCNFVHATVFERESFLRTAYLPPHTLNHLNKTTVQSMPHLSEGTASQPFVVPSIASNPPVPTMLGNATPVSIMGCAPAVGVDTRATVSDIFRSAVTDNASLKREWTDMDDYNASPRDLDCTENNAKKCKHCDINEFRLNFIKTKANNLRKSNDELNKKMTVINSKGQRLLTVLATMIKSVLHKPKAPGTSSAFLNISEEKEQVLREQVALLSSVSAFNEENTKSVNSANPGLQSFLAKLLIGSMDPLLSPDGS